MKYLFVALEADASAPGIVFKTLLNELAQKGLEIHLICPVIDKGFLSDKITLLPCHGYHCSWHHSQQFWKTLGCNPRDKFWALQTYRKNKGRIKKENYDAVISLISNGAFAPLDFSSKVSKKFHLKWMIQSVDGIPGPKVWDEGDPKAYDNLYKHIRSVCSRSVFFISSNEYMLEYQKTVLGDYQGKTGVVYTPWTPLARPFRAKAHEKFTLLYAGSLYGLRRIEGLLKGFQKFNLENPESRLVFVGSVAPQYHELYAQMGSPSSIEFLPFTNDIQSFYEQADVLIDVAADIQDDVYLSSKIISYLPVPLPILAVSGENSPARNLMVSDSVFHCGNDAEQVYLKIKEAKALTHMDARNELLVKFSASTQADTTLAALKEL